MGSALIGLIGVVIGILCNEYFRRENRIEKYSEKIFEKRLQIHESLFEKIKEDYEAINNLINDRELTLEERHNIVSKVILELADFIDVIEFYLDERLVVQVMTLFMGTEEILPDSADREEKISTFRKDLKLTKKMIIDESGVTQAVNSFRKVSKSKPTSSIISYFESLKKTNE
ncbi:hypothetical protein V6347_14955 [Acinetobacter baumannii]|uniref:Uncharacterized protein n=2 Tax=Acinetobacter calcoaceticus/baumannii complex TaxID=909768 RepID=A0A2L1VLB7_ACINO|nr:MULTISPECIES: hypothetical protein [Acinetobacter calcoaceticus/baumannii complex]AVF45921.1 hypothetical protein AL533_16955 [Acinetobacter nosocomialis]MBP1502665.1 hypothetical protein [Acinetobacter nosocomialis]MBR7687308.1 hypothetical protein [Acinetobacter nosocomialis]MBR7701482.1 hypothetical protein [Acinetobacter nosocomialis]MBR7760760.1 hypothetical protein [Acinetobacter nosocomialis]